jgi:hypothetical protein
MTAKSAGPKPLRASRASASEGGAEDEQRALVDKLYKMLGRHIRAIAGRVDAEDGAARELEQLVRCFKTIHELRAALGGPDGGEDGQKDKRNPDEIRAALQRRLAGRFASERTDEAPGEPE